MMPESDSSLLPLRQLGLHRRFYGDEFSEWEMGLGRREDDDELKWQFSRAFQENADSVLLNSILQRLKLYEERFSNFPMEISGGFTSKDHFKLLADHVEGEPLSHFLESGDVISEFVLFSLLKQLVGHLKAFSRSPRLLSNLRLEDFFLSLEGGGRPKLEPALAFAMIRDEEPESDYQLALRWFHDIARLIAWIRVGKVDKIARSDLRKAKAMRPLIRQIEKGGDCSLLTRFEQLDEVIQGELERLQTSAPASTVGGLSRRLKGAMEELLFQGLQESLEHEGIRILEDENPFSIYSLRTRKFDSDETGMAYLIPPEDWFEQSLVNRVSRKMTHPYMGRHHNGVGVSAVYCESEQTVIVSDGSESVPLPLYLLGQSGIDSKAVLLIAEKVERALGEFESAEFPLELESPWQIELCPEAEVKGGLTELVETAIDDWPVWDIKVRVELPAEHLLATCRSCSWRSFRMGNDVPFFSALLAWMLEWKRFDWAMRFRRYGEEPLSWDPDRENLFRSCDDAGGSSRRDLLKGLAQSIDNPSFR